MQIVTYLINLDGSEARLKSAVSQLEAHDMAFERVPAYDGRNLDLATLGDYDEIRTKAYMGRPLRGGEIGCYYSHRDCVQRFLKSSADFAIVLEDDMVLEPEAMHHITKMLDWLTGQNIDWDVINIGADRHKYVSPLQQFGDRQIVRAHYFPMTTTGLVWSRVGATRFIETHDVVMMPIDNALREWQCVQNRGLSIIPALVTTSGAISDIDVVSARRSKDGRGLVYGLRKQRRMLRNKLRAWNHRRRGSAGMTHI